MMAWLSAVAKPIECWYSGRGHEDPNESMDMDVWVRPREYRLKVADDMAWLHSEFPSSKLVLLELTPLPPNGRGRDRLLEAHLAVFMRFESGGRPLVDAWLSEGV